MNSWKFLGIACGNSDVDGNYIVQSQDGTISNFKPKNYIKT